MIQMHARLLSDTDVMRLRICRSSFASPLQLKRKGKGVQICAQHFGGHASVVHVSLALIREGFEARFMVIEAWASIPHTFRLLSRLVNFEFWRCEPWTFLSNIYFVIVLLKEALKEVESHLLQDKENNRVYYVGGEETLNYIDQVLKEQGPFQGFWAFSQVLSLQAQSSIDPQFFLPACPFMLSILRFTLCPSLDIHFVCLKYFGICAFPTRPLQHDFKGVL